MGVGLGERESHRAERVEDDPADLFGFVAARGVAAAKRLADRFLVVISVPAEAGA